LQDLIDSLDEKKSKEIEIANQTIANTEERAAKIAIIEARTNAEKERLQKKQRDLDVKKAQFDKAQAIANVIQTTAFGILNYSKDPVLLPLLPLFIAVSAAQLATVVAQPIPRYKHGKNVSMWDDYSGPAIVDDGGKPEAIIRENGNVEIGGSTPRITHLSKRDIVLPDANMLVNYVLAGHMGGTISLERSSTNNYSLEKAVDRMEKNVVSAIQNKKELHLNASDSGLAAMWKHGANQINYINQQTNW
jgi:hypothetical protein